MAYRPRFADTYETPIVAVSTANTNTDGSTGTYATIYTATATEFVKIDRIFVAALDTTVDNTVRIFKNAFLIDEFDITVDTQGAGDLGFAESHTFGDSKPLYLKASDVLKASLNTTGDTINVGAAIQRFTI